MLYLNQFIVALIKNVQDFGKILVHLKVYIPYFTER